MAFVSNVNDRKAVGVQTAPVRQPIQNANHGRMRIEDGPLDIVGGDGGTDDGWVRLNDLRIALEESVAIKFDARIHKGPHTGENEITTEAVVVEYGPGAQFGRHMLQGRDRSDRAIDAKRWIFES